MDYVEEAKKGNKEAFGMLVQAYKLKMYKTAKAILRNEDDVCDAIQDALISIYKNISKLENNEYFATWATRIVINKCYDIIKKQGKNNIINIEDAYEVKTYDNYDENYILNNILNKIDENLKLIIVMYYYNELNVKEIAEILNIPEGTVKSRLHTARIKLYNILSKEEGEI